MLTSPRPEDILQRLLDRCDGENGFAVLTVLEADGSTPAKPGAKALVDATGAMSGTIGGGAMEAEAQRRAVEAIQRGQACVFDFALQGGATQDQDPICGGRMRVLVDPNVRHQRSAYAQARAARQARERGVLLTSVCGQDPARVTVEWFSAAAIGSGDPFPGAAALRSALQREAAQCCREEAPSPGVARQVLVEPVVPCPQLVILGGGHVGQAVAAQASLVGFDLAVIDDRAEFTQSALFPEGTVTRCGDMAAEAASWPATTDTFFVIVTRGHQHDAEVLRACLTRPAAYVGMIGSRRKVAVMRRDFIATGQATEAQFERVYAPIGLDLGAQTVPEIAASIVAQLISVRRRGSAPRMPCT